MFFVFLWHFLGGVITVIIFSNVLFVSLFVNDKKYPQIADFMNYLLGLAFFVMCCWISYSIILFLYNFIIS